MRPTFPLLLVAQALGIVALALGTQAPAQTCTGLSCQQVSCPGGGTTSISGVVYAPNDTDPLPNVTVYVPNSTVAAFTPGVACPVVGAAPSGSPLVGTTTATNGSFTISDVPVGTAIPLVMVSGRWRRQITIDTSQGSCTNTVVDPTMSRFPRNQTEGDIPKFAISSGGVDQVECILRKVGIADSEFTNPGGIGRINIFPATNGPGSQISDGNAVLGEASLMGNASTLGQYDVLMLPCEGGQVNKPAAELANLITWANAGGRVYASHYEYDYLWKNPPFDSVAQWTGSTSATAASGTATVVTNFVVGKTLSAWLELVGASPTAPPATAQIEVDTIKHDISGVNSPTQPWLTLNTALGGVTNPIMQFVFDTPVGVQTGQCGRILYNEYHVEGGTSTNTIFPTECSSGTTLSPQEKLLEFSLFELTDDGGSATLTPASADFGSEPVGFTTAPQVFTWTNNSTFSAGVTLLAATGDFNATQTNCTVVPAGTSCSIYVTFAPTALGARTGILSVGSGAQTLTANLTGNGTPGLSLSPATLTFGSIDIGASQTLPLTVTNNAPGGLALPVIALTGDYSATTNCPTVVPALSTCTLFVKFSPTASGTRPGTISLNAGYATLSAALTGNGLDFSLAIAPASGTVIAGLTTTTVVTMTPIAGFVGGVVLTCGTTTPGATCTPSGYNYGLASGAVVTVTIGTTSQYSVIGYGGVGSTGFLSLLALGTVGLLWFGRRRTNAVVRATLMLLVLATGAIAITGCSGKLPQTNSVYTGPGDYTFTLSATDGIITHSATYALHVTTK